MPLRGHFTMHIPIYIISYRGTDAALKPKRVQFHKNQLTQLVKLFPQSPITVVAQNYIDVELEQEVTTYIRTGQMYPAQARNIMLKQFYESNEDWALFIDDDILFKEEYHPLAFIDNLVAGLYNTNPVTLIMPSYGMLRPINGPLLDAKEITTNNFILEGNTKFRSGMFLIRNIKKFTGKEYYFDEVLKTNEDYAFGCELIKNNMYVHTHWNIVAHDQGQNDSVLMLEAGSNVRFNDVFIQLEEEYKPLKERWRLIGHLLLHRINHNWNFNMSKVKTGKRSVFTFTENEIIKGNNDPFLALFG